MIHLSVLRRCHRGFVPLEALCHKMSTATATSEQIGISKAKPFSEVPGPKGIYNMPYIGIAFHFKPFTNFMPTEIIFVLDAMKDKYGDIVKMKMGANEHIYLFHPDYVRTVFQLPFKKHRRISIDISDVYCKRTGLPPSLSSLEGEEWAAFRKPAQEKMLRPAVVSSYVPLIGGVTNDFIESLKKKDIVEDLQTKLMLYTTESVGMLCFNRRLGCFDSDTTPEIVLYTQEFFQTMMLSITAPIKTFKYFRTPLYKRFERCRNGMLQITTREISAQMKFLKQLEKDNELDKYLEQDPNFMYSLLTDPRMTPQKVESIVTTLFGAGIDSTANSMLWVLCDLALNPVKQETLYREIKSIVGDSNRTLTKDHLAQMSYLKACIKESQRKTFPVTIGPLRTTEEDIVLGGYLIPKETKMQAVMSSMTKDERFFPRPQEYIPERWLRETDCDIAKGQEFPFALKPFGFGPRGCIGQRFAEMELQIGVTKMVQNFKLSLPPEVKEVKQGTMSLFTAPGHTVTLHLKSRKE